jgi:polygalacturonase
VNCITANDGHDIEICGPGKIDGQGQPWWEAFLADKTGFPRRPCLIVLSRCARVSVKEITLVNSPGFHLVPAHCTDVAIDGITVTAPADSPNTDAIDASGWGLFIKHCTLDVGDDNIALKPSDPVDPSKPSCGNILITDCTFLHGHGLSIGGQTQGGLRGMRVSNCTFKDTTNGIRLKASREAGGVVEDLHYDRITMENIRNPVLITSYYPKAPKNPGEDPALASNTRGPVWRDITISNLAATGSQNAGIIWGVPELPVEKITFTSVKISAGVGMKIYNARAVSFVDSNISAGKGEKTALYNAQVSGL